MSATWQDETQTDVEPVWTVWAAQDGQGDLLQSCLHVCWTLNATDTHTHHPVTVTFHNTSREESTEAYIPLLFSLTATAMATHSQDNISPLPDTPGGEEDSSCPNTNVPTHGHGYVPFTHSSLCSMPPWSISDNGRQTEGRACRNNRACNYSMRRTKLFWVRTQYKRPSMAHHSNGKRIIFGVDIAYGTQWDCVRMRVQWRKSSRYVTSQWLRISTELLYQYRNEWLLFQNRICNYFVKTCQDADEVITPNNNNGSYSNLQHSIERITVRMTDIRWFKIGLFLPSFSIEICFEQWSHFKNYFRPYSKIIFYYKLDTYNEYKYRWFLLE